MISALSKQLQQELEYILLKPDCHSWWISKMQSGREEERYAIKLSFWLTRLKTIMTNGALFLYWVNGIHLWNIISMNLCVFLIQDLIFTVYPEQHTYYYENEVVTKFYTFVDF